MRAMLLLGISNIVELFVLATVLYLEARIICMRVPTDGVVDMKRFHDEEGRIIIYVVLAAATAGLNIQARGGYRVDVADTISKYNAVFAMLGLSLAGAIFKGRWSQAAVAIGLFATWIWYFGTLQGALA